MSQGGSVLIYNNALWHLRTSSEMQNGTYVFTASESYYVTGDMFNIGDHSTGVRPAIKISNLSAIPEVEEELPEEPTTPEPPDDPTPDEPETPDTPSDPTDDCSCNCHKSGFMGFIWKIVRLLWKLFKKNPVCACGIAHY